MADRPNSHFLALVKPYAGWAALGFFIAALFSSIVARNFAIPLGLYAAALALAIFRYWKEIRAFEFWGLDEWVRARLDAWGINEWHAPHHAAEAYCNKVALRTRNEAAAEMNTIMMEIIRQTNGPQSGQLDFSRKVPDLNAERNARYEAAQVRLNQTNSLLSRELHFYLARGDLLAKGLLTTDDIGRAERIIPTARWRVMSLDIAKAQATGMGWRYSGIVIGVKPKKPNPAKPDMAVRASEPPPTAQGAANMPGAPSPQKANSPKVQPVPPAAVPRPPRPST